MHRLLCATDAIVQELLTLSSSGGGKEELLLKKTLHKIPLLFSTTAFAITSYIPSHGAAAHEVKGISIIFSSAPGSLQPVPH